MKTPPIVSPSEWDEARERLLVKEKEFTRARDAMAAQRRRMPWMAVEKGYGFEGPNGPASLLDLFEGRRPTGRVCAIGGMSGRFGGPDPRLECSRVGADEFSHARPSYQH